LVSVVSVARVGCRAAHSWTLRILLITGYPRTTYALRQTVRHSTVPRSDGHLKGLAAAPHQSIQLNFPIE
jgi:hypothetical protein